MYFNKNLQHLDLIDRCGHAGIEAGFYTKEAHELRRQELYKQSADFIAADRRRQYEQLKKEFEGQ